MQLLQEVPKMARVMRHPVHNFQLRCRPYVIQPFMIAPVLPGETMKNLLLQARVVTDPIKNPLIGWWNEYYFFYVKLRDLNDRDVITTMIMDPNATLSTLDSATALDNYHENGSSGVDVDWVKLCLERVIEEYFRFEGETAGSATLTSVTTGTVFAAGSQHSSYIDSLIDDDDYVNAAALNEDLADAGSEGGTKVTITEIENAKLRWQIAQMQGVTQMTFEEYCASYYGGKVPEEELFKPELIRYIREWTYPTNTIDPTNGTPRSACSWVIQEKADKQRFFKEPGFIFGVQCTRPKVYYKNLSSNAVMLMNRCKDWLPPALADSMYASMKKVAATDPPVTVNTDDYWIDIKDLLLYGDQFVNFALTATDANIVGLPTAAGEKRYVPSADIDAMFVSASPANQVRTDGVVKLSIAGRQVDTSPNVIGLNTTV